MGKVVTESSEDKTATIIEFGNRRKYGPVSRVSSGRVTVMVETASDDAIGSDINICLTRCLQESGWVTVSDDRPDWVFSIIAFHQYDVVEMSVILRKLFRSTAPGTEMAISDSSGQAILRRGHWVYESLRYHGLHGVPRGNLEIFLKGLVDEFTSQHLRIPQDRKIRT